MLWGKELFQVYQDNYPLNPKLEPRVKWGSVKEDVGWLANCLRPGT